MESIWGHSITFKFLEAYKNEPVLWNLSHPDNKQRAIVNASWKRVLDYVTSEEPDCPFLTLDMLKKKKESLMASYRSLKRKKLKNKSVSWFAFDFMDSFLCERFEKSYALKNDLTMETIKDEESLVIEEDDDGRCYDPEDDDMNVEFLETENFSESESPREPAPVVNDDQDNITNVTNDDPLTPSVKKRKRDKEFNSLKSNISDDECRLFGELLAVKLMKLPELVREQAMHDIDNIVHRAKLKSTRSKIKKEHSFL